LGWDPFFEAQLQGAPEALAARIAADHGDAYELWGASGVGWGRLAGRLRHDLRERELPGVGDWVLVDAPPGPDRTAVIQGVLERRTVFLRGAAGREARAQVIAANVDVVLVVCGLDEDFNVRRIERYLARVWASGAQPVVVLTKADLVADPGERIEEAAAHAPGADVLAVSAPRDDGLAAVRALLAPGRTLALVGSSGAGKSTLVNALLGEERMATGPVRASDGRGRHVTTHRQLVRLPGGGLLLDTPGMRELQLLDEEGLDAAFDDVALLATGCRFGDCTHGSEPGCAVRAAVAAGELAPGRLESFVKLRDEARAWGRRHDARLSRADDRAWGRLIAEAQRQIRRKRGEE
ncbi:MAG TPA: ribosome small subunit-dependent GTPase A, partial [Anaeromyxobacteraceae bacterium]|nr:ribosome small subunit-dependent GTPase A [Anaeromyxobacteraceae bacterium]